MKNKKFRFSLIFSSSILLFVMLGVFILSSLIPESVLMSDTGESESFIPDGSTWLLSVKEDPADEVWQNNAEKIDGSSNDGYNATVYLGGVFPIKSVEFRKSTGEQFVRVGGDAVGISLSIDGILVVGLSDVASPDGTSSPAKDAGFKKGDIIKKINGKIVTDISEVADIVRKSSATLTIEGMRDEEYKEWKVTAIKDFSSQNKLGLWIRDSVSGIGTLTFASEKGFGALGHPISDIDTGNFVKSSNGSIYSASVVGVDKGQKGVPGSLSGIFTSQKIGTIAKNSSCGVFGRCDGTLGGDMVAVAKKEEIKCTDATILCDVGDGVKSFDAEIVRLILSGEATKGMVIHITDDRLIEKTGGIVQGMSGSPIVQNGKLIGAVTHVFVNDPTRGYGIFIENMLAEAEKIK